MDGRVALSNRCTQKVGQGPKLLSGIRDYCVGYFTIFAFAAALSKYSDLLARSLARSMQGRASGHTDHDSIQKRWGKPASKRASRWQDGPGTLSGGKESERASEWASEQTYGQTDRETNQELLYPGWTASERASRLSKQMEGSTRNSIQGLGASEQASGLADQELYPEGGKGANERASEEDFYSGQESERADRQSKNSIQGEGARARE